MKNIHLFIIFFTLTTIFMGCNKGYLEVKPDKALLVPKTLEDLELLMNNEAIMNITPGLQIIASDEFVATDSYLSGTAALERNSYLWNEDIFESNTPFDWNIPYQQVFYANNVLDILVGIKRDQTNEVNYDRVKGMALFFRAHAFYQLSQLFAKPYRQTSATTDLGIPLRLVADVNIPSKRATLEETYKQILEDLSAAYVLLPARPNVKSKPGKAATLALRARVHLLMGDYTNALSDGIECRSFTPNLMDYNLLNPTAAPPFPVSLPNGNDEVIFHSATYNYSFLISSTQVTVDGELYASYVDNDLRKSLFFNPSTKRFKGSYTGYSTIFTGLAVDEVYFLIAECLARLERADEAILELNALLSKRWKTGTFIPLKAQNAQEALLLVLNERKKGLISRGLRWGDLRRLNQDPRFAIELRRTYLGSTYVLLSNSSRYVFPIPQPEIVYSGIVQNER